MTYELNFHLIDDVIIHLDGAVASADPFTASRYVGFYSVSAATVIELSVKNIIVAFASRNHPVFGGYVSNKYERLNAKVSLSDLDGHIAPFGRSYRERFKNLLDRVEKINLRKNKSSLKSSYGNLLSCRNQFAHEGVVPLNSTYTEVKRGFEAGKIVLACLQKSLT